MTETLYNIAENVLGDTFSQSTVSVDYESDLTSTGDFFVNLQLRHLKTTPQKQITIIRKICSALANEEY